MRGEVLRGLSIVRQLRRQARMSREEMLACQAGQFSRLLKYVWSNSAFYREYYSDHGIRESQLESVTPVDLPMVWKRLLMENFDGVVTDPSVRFQDILAYWEDPSAGPQGPLQHLHIMSTSGSTGVPALIVQDPHCWLMNRMAFLVRLIHKRGRRKRVHRRAFLGGAFPMGAGAMMTRRRPFFSPEPAILLPHRPIEETVAKLNTYQPTLLTGFSSPIAHLAREALAGRLRISPEVVGTSGENLSVGMEDDIEGAWPGCHVNAYSASESLCIMARRYRQPFTVYDDLNVVEVVDSSGMPVPAGGTGEVILTNLHNRIFPLIRYRIGDLATALESPARGPFSVIRELLGREAEWVPVIRDDGTRGKIQSVSFTGFVSPELIQYRLQLRAPDVLTVQYVSTQDIEDRMRERILYTLQESGAGRRMRIETERVSHLPVDPGTNKVRFMEVLCDLGKEGA